MEWDFEDSDLAALVGSSISQPQMEHRPAESLGLEEDPMKLSSSGRLSGSNSGGDQLKFLCLVDGCRADLSRCREYHRRHRVCELHSKAPVVVVRGEQKRFCQQCSRFHSLVDFDEVKRSCRKRLNGHNQRRRKPKPESFYFSSHFFFSTYKGPRILQFSNPGACATTNVRCIWPVKDKKGAESMRSNYHHQWLHATDEQSPPNSFNGGGDKQSASPKSTKCCALYLLSSHPTQNSVSGLNHLAQSTVTTTHPCSHDVEDRPVNREMMFPMRPDGFWDN